MNRDRMADDDRAARVVERLFASLEEGGAPPPASEDPAEQALLREYTEVLGLLAWSSRPQAPSPAVAESIRREIAGEQVAERVPPRPMRPPARRLESPPPSSPRWLAALAAVLALAVLGLSGSLVRLAGEQERALADLGSRLERTTERLDQWSGAADRLVALEERLALVTGPAVEVCALRPTDEATGRAAAARGVLYVADDHQRWYLALEGLPAAPEGAVYHVWFLAGGRAVSAGDLELRAGRGDLMAHTMPDAVQAVFVTVESASDLLAPSGPRVLYGDEAMTIL